MSTEEVVKDKLTNDDKQALHEWMMDKLHEKHGGGELTTQKTLDGKKVSEGYDVFDFLDLLYEECPDAIMAMFRVGADSYHDQGEEEHA